MATVGEQADQTGERTPLLRFGFMPGLGIFYTHFVSHLIFGNN
jgi:hypothetical protein